MIWLALAVVVGSKQFTESIVVAEIAAQALRRDGISAEHRRELGGTRVLFEALRAGQIDLYPEYTGTIREELLPGEGDLGAALARLGLRMSDPIGFEDTYAIGLRRAVATELGIRALSDLARHPGVRIGLSNEFLRRRDGWARLREIYALPQEPRGLEHALAYQALTSGALEATDLYSTDAEIRAADLVVLADDRHAFPRYDAVFLHRASLPDAAVRTLASIHVDAGQMIAMNARVRLDGVPETRVAATFLGIRGTADESRPRRILRRTLEHLVLVGISLAAAVAISVPLGIVAFRRARLGQIVLGATGVLQTVPSLALLVLMIPLLGIGAGPAIVALFLYAMLPIVRGTHAGLASIPTDLRESADALGLPRRAALTRIELPLASRAILSGIATAAVIDVGTATLGALIGAGGYGQPILAGIRLADTGLILEGAIPAALLAIAVQGLFAVLERVLVPRGLRV